LSQDERYKDLPIVQKDANYRFYAGTPLTTDSNINVGCFFVLDSRPHVKFTDSEKATMGDMGTLIMDFLKVSREASEGRRAARLSHGLNYFVEGGSTFNNVTPSPVSTIQRQSSNASTGYTGTRRSSGSQRKSRSSSSRSHSISSASSFGSTSDHKSDQSMPSSSYRPPSGKWSDLGQPAENNQSNSWTFRRAANLIRESLELESDSGVAFVEAGSEAMLDRWSDSDTSSSQDTGKAASLLAISTENNLFGPYGDHAVSHPVANLGEEFVHRLLNTYQKGKIWSLHRDGQQSSSDSDDSSPSRKGRSRSRGSRAPKKWKLRETAMLNRCFPAAAQVLFVPLWNAANSQWFGGCFCWNNVESNVFDPSVELSSLLGFGSSIMAECNRVESLISDRQKADFLGSIS
jgi:hypothetical protein